MNYPVELSFKLLAIASQIYIRDANGALLGYVKQKLFKLKEDINIFADESQTQQLYNIKADRMLDFSATYNFTDAQGDLLGSIKRKGMRSLWRANYEIFDTDSKHVMTIREENGWIKVIDSLIGEVPVAGMFTGYFFNPSYIVSKIDETRIARLQKQPAFFEGKFHLSPLSPMSADDEVRVLLSVLTMTLLERSRG
ncbi:MAG: hypothetical protein ACR2M8_03420 [Pyrinomonadaceae bacterium]|jgi:uncharacterized protein YxjI|nr:hypothetical protein [Blastocatellia bacterium]MDQ3219730.1 hypothetical protein [Acidobacteriota bacterium]MDQ3490752.1 hypothetical protein [Acidobacteriota bacterium]